MAPGFSDQVCRKTRSRAQALGTREPQALGRSNQDINLYNTVARKVCEFEQPCQSKSVIIVTGKIEMFHYPGRKTILCIDDDDGMLGYQRVLLERRGYAVLTAASGRRGSQIAAACAIAAVIVD